MKKMKFGAMLICVACSNNLYKVKIIAKGGFR